MKFTVFTPKTKPLLGVDIGSTYIKAVLLTPGKAQWECRGVACELIPTSALKERNITDFDSVATTLKKMMLKLKLTHPVSVIAVSGTAVISKVIHMPKQLVGSHLAEHIEIEADSLIPYPLDLVYWDFEALTHSTEDRDTADILLTSAPKQIVDNRITVTREAGLNPKIVNTELGALENLARLHTGQSNIDDITIHIGNELMHIVVVRNNHLRYSKEYQFGLNSMLHDIALMQQCPLHEALKLLHNNTLDSQWQKLVLPIFHAQLEQHILRACQLMQSTLNSDSPQHIYLCGGVGMLPNITQSLSCALNIKVDLLDPAANMKISDTISLEYLTTFKPMLCIAMGLALRCDAHGIH